MKTTDLLTLFDGLVADARSTMAAKNHDYTAASDDALANFKLVAGMLGLEPRQVWAVFFLKHAMAALAWAKTGKVESEGLKGRFLDLVNFSALGLAVVQECPEKATGQGNEAQATPAAPGPFEALWEDQAAWSRATFGTDQERGPEGSLKHLGREAEEALRCPLDRMEYADLLILTMDASRRAGLTREGLLAAAQDKMRVNKERRWPKAQPGEPCEHLKDPRAPDPATLQVVAGPHSVIKGVVFKGVSSSGRTCIPDTSSPQNGPESQGLI